ncbi:MAG: hypothetical protein KAH54_11965, partial [Candidatus Sabulitectum sp.]|nr:hypothetical protein [Candidatus Sabulitectum sp.]
NNLSSTSIVNMYYLVNGQSTIHKIPTPFLLQPDSTISITLPSLLLNPIVFEDEESNVFFLGNYPASLNGDTIKVSLANKEFGQFFNRIYGSYLIVLKNSSMVPLYSVSVSGDPFPDTNLLRGQILLPDEYLCIWADSGTMVEAYATDVNGNLSSALMCTASAEDTLYQFTPPYFYHNGNVLDPEVGGSGSWIVNCLPYSHIILIEAFDETGFTGGIDCYASPLQTWDRVYLTHSSPLSYIVCTDMNGRTYSLIEPDIQTDEYLVDMLSLDFGFGFPE